jgi:hypothetical protein
MKKLIFLLIFLPFVAVSQTNLNQSAEEFVRSYFKMFEDKKWDEILRSYSEDGQIIWPNHTISPSMVKMKSILDRCKTEFDSFQIDVKWILTDLMGPNSAMVTASYFMETTDRSGNIRMTDNLDVHLISVENGSWKIKKLIIQDNYPMIYSDHINKELQTDQIGPLQRIDSALIHYTFLMMCNLEFFKQRGISPAELGKMIGGRDAKIDHGTKGDFSSLASDFLWGLKTLSTYTEVLERNDNTLKIKFIPISIPDAWGPDVTHEDLRVMMQNWFTVAADDRGGKCSLEANGKFWLFTLNKK